MWIMKKVWRKVANQVSIFRVVSRGHNITCVNSYRKRMNDESYLPPISVPISRETLSLCFYTCFAAAFCFLWSYAVILLEGNSFPLCPFSLSRFTQSSPFSYVHHLFMASLFTPSYSLQSVYFTRWLASSDEIFLWSNAKLRLSLDNY